MGKNLKAVSNEEIIAALMQHGTVKAAAEAAGTAPRTIYDRMADRDFREEYARARNEVLRAAVQTTSANLSAAVNLILDVMNDRGNNPAVRLQAAQTFLSYAEKFSSRLAAVETAAYLMAEQERERETWEVI